MNAAALPGNPAPGRGRRAQTHPRTSMDRNHRNPRPYARPRLVVYGALQELTLTLSNDKNKNDSIQGQNNLKT